LSTARSIGRTRGRTCGPTVNLPRTGLHGFGNFLSNDSSMRDQFARMGLAEPAGQDAWRDVAATSESEDGPTANSGFSGGDGGLLSGATDGHPNKRPRLQMVGDWTCVACGNTNFADRSVCNMRKCGAIRGAARQDWQCTSCGNLNFADRMFCNMRNCGAARGSGVLAEQQVVIPRVQPSSPQPSSLRASAASVGLSVQASGGSATAGPSSRFPGGLSNACGMRPAPDQWPLKLSQPPQMQPQPMTQLRLHPPKRFRHAKHEMRQDPSVPNEPIELPFRHAAPGPALKIVAPAQPPSLKPCGPPTSQRGVKQGDWSCSCGNWNFRHRAFCNMCGLPRVLETWTCQACHNKNFPDRAFCNMRRCNAPRSDVEPGVLNELLSKVLGKGRRLTDCVPS